MQGAAWSFIWLVKHPGAGWLRGFLRIFLKDWLGWVSPKWIRYENTDNFTAGLRGGVRR